MTEYCSRSGNGRQPPLLSLPEQCGMYKWVVDRDLDDAIKATLDSWEKILSSVYSKRGKREYVFPMFIFTNPKYKGGWAKYLKSKGYKRVHSVGRYSIYLKEMKKNG